MNQAEVALPTQIREAVIAHARFCQPEEACGLLASDADGRLRMAYCLTNTAHSESAFLLDPTEHFRALSHAETQAWTLAGVFHSHVGGPAFPSPTDVARAPDPEWLYVVVSLAHTEPRVEGFRIRGHQVSRVDLVDVPID